MFDFKNILKITKTAKIKELKNIKKHPNKKYAKF